jgi:hypothetical protein
MQSGAVSANRVIVHPDAVVIRKISSVQSIVHAMENVREKIDGMRVIHLFSTVHFSFRYSFYDFINFITRYLAICQDGD